MLKRTLGSKAKLILEGSLSAEEIAMIQALYSRNPASAEDHINEVYAMRREVLYDLFQEHKVFSDSMTTLELARVVDDVIFGRPVSERVQKFLGKFYVGYGHKSIGDCGSTTLFFEGVSMLAAKAIQDWPLYSGQETSTRYMDMSNRKIIDPVNTPESEAILRRWMDFYMSHQDAVAEEIMRRYPKGAEESDTAYAGAVKARTFDSQRGFLPAGMTTQVSWHGNLRQMGDHLTLGIHHPSMEISGLFVNAGQLLCEQYPSSAGSFGEAAGVSGTAADARGAQARRSWDSGVAQAHTYWEPASGHHRPLYTTIDPHELEQYEHLLQMRPRGSVLPHFMTELGQLTFRFKLDFGSFRDIQRHRNGVCRMPLLTTSCGFEPWYIEQLPAGIAPEAVRLVDEQTKAINEATSLAVDQQYLTAFGYRVPCQLTMGLPAAVYVMELRSGKMIHPTLRRVIHNMVDVFYLAHPDVPLHIDRTLDPWDVRRGLQTITRTA